MVKSCCAINCTNRYDDDCRARNITFHLFPADERRRAVWTRAVRRIDSRTKKDWQPSTSSVLCSCHFDVSNFRFDRGNTLLKPDAVPTIFAFPNSQERKLIRQQLSAVSKAAMLPIPQEPEIQQSSICRMPANSSKCFVPGCTSGYKSCTTKFSLFKPPKSPSKLAAWSRAIRRADRTLTENCKICELHFESQFIVRDYTAVVDGQVVSIDRGRPRLTDDAVPRIFPNLPKYRTKTVSQRHMKRTRSASPDSMLQNGSQEKRQHQQQIEIDQVFNDHLDFESLTLQHASLCLKSWISSASSDCICFGKVNIVNGQLSVVRSVTVFPDMTVKIYCNGKSSSLPNCNMVTTNQQFHQVMDLVDAAKDCPGSSEQNFTDDIRYSRNGVFENGKWRHVNCIGLTVNGERCLACRHFRKLMQTTAARFRKNDS